MLPRQTVAPKGLFPGRERFSGSFDGKPILTAPKLTQRISAWSNISIPASSSPKNWGFNRGNFGEKYAFQRWPGFAARVARDYRESS